MRTNVTELTSVERRNLESVTDVLEFWNTQDIAGILEFYSDEITWHNMALQETYQGKSGVSTFLEGLFTAFPDLRFSVEEKIPRDDFVAERWRIDATHLGPYMGIPPTGKPIVIKGMGLVKLKDGKFLVDNFYYDALGVMQQMGIFPPLSIGETLPGRIALWAMVNRNRVMAGAGIFAVGALALRMKR
jgi:steroid delta-isomerase-like uncharacterized protein